MNATGIQSFTIQNKTGLQLTVLNYGAIIHKLIVPDKNNRFINIVVGYANDQDYLNNPLYMGACIGRYAGRINNGTFSLDNVEYDLYQKEGIHLHGGQKGYDQQFWTLEEIEHIDEPYIRMSYVSKDMEEGYPGNVKVDIVYTLTTNNELHITYSAFTDKITIINLTNHSYFNLGEATTAINAHELQIKASQYLEIDKNLIPTGKLLNVKNTPYDFTKGKTIDTLKIDDTFIFDTIDKNEEVISLHTKNTGIEMTATTNQPAVVVFTPKTFNAICLELQNFPDAPNHSHFPSALLKPGEKYKNETAFKFSIKA